MVKVFLDAFIGFQVRRLRLQDAQPNVILVFDIFST